MMRQLKNAYPASDSISLTSSTASLDGSRFDELAEEAFGLSQKGNEPLYVEGSSWAKWPRILMASRSYETNYGMAKYGRGLHPAIYRWMQKSRAIYLVGSTVKRKMHVDIVAWHRRSRRGDDFRDNERINVVDPWSCCS